MKKIAIILCICGILWGLCAGGANAQVFSGFGSGFPVLGDLLSGRGSCGTSPCKIPGPSLYVGYGTDGDRQTSFSVQTMSEGLGSPGFLTQGIRQAFPVRGVWVGLGQELSLTESMKLLATGWYLFPFKTDSREDDMYAIGGTTPFYPGRAWSTNNEWWFLDTSLLVRTTGNFYGVLGIRYDFFTTRFKNPFNSWLPGDQNDEGDVILSNFIPLMGVQYSYESGSTGLTFRVVGFPTLLGSIKYNQSGIGTRLEAKGNYSDGYFLECFTEYSLQVYGDARFSLFGRWNMAQGRASLNVDILGNAGFIPNDTFQLGLHRNSWTLGGAVSLDFAL